MNRPNNKDVGHYVKGRLEFQAHNMNGKWVSPNKREWLYVVYSYGEHFPMYVYSQDSGDWFENGNRYSNTTTRHKSQARPTSNTIKVDTDTIREIVAFGVPPVLNRRNTITGAFT